MTSGPLYVPTTTDTAIKPATRNFGNNILQHQMKKNKTFFDVSIMLTQFKPI
ncbi:hypothetical protein JG687_00016802 [Phytophthora cactorum]|uniref:Uncharacterized protein n=1 Tax=Phytophthora cactorum TaxID=29920 RepID=A0A8T1TS51_9STRA|nr:hypothetical protein JG687_00016802 [Phytophthora cactorum]